MPGDKNNRGPTDTAPIDVNDDHEVWLGIEILLPHGRAFGVRTWKVLLGSYVIAGAVLIAIQAFLPKCPFQLR